MPITGVHIRGMKALADVHLEKVAPLTLLVGANGSGKTTVLQALSLFGVIGELSRPRPQAWSVMTDALNACGGAHACVRTGASELQIRVDRSGATSDTAEIVVSLQPNDEHWNGRVAFPNQPGFKQINWSTSYSDAVRPNWSHLDDWKLDAQWLAFDAAAMRRPSVASSSHSVRLDHNGANLATVIAAWANLRRDDLRAVEAALRQIVPATRQVLAEPAATPDGPGWQLVIEYTSVGRVSAQAISEGTLLTLALLVATQRGPTDGERLVLLDDIDRGLHPEAQLELMTYLTRLIAHDPGLQVIATTHSPYLVDAVDPGQVWVLATDTDGASHAAPLTRALDKDLRAQGLRAGELWANIGEAWILSGARSDAA